MLAQPFQPTLAAGEIHLWRLDLAGDCPVDDDHILDESDVVRAERFAFDRDRNRFLRGRYGLRSILAAYLHISPRKLAIKLNPHGKPLLEPALGLGFNLSHSGDHGLLAVGRSARIGVDIEELSSPKEIRALADSLFTKEEVQSLNIIDDDRLAAVFLTCWTRKEAYLKAVGVGLSIDPRSVHVGTTAQCRHVPFVGSPSDEFLGVTSLLGSGNCVAALAVEGGHAETKIFDWAPKASPRC